MISTREVRQVIDSDIDLVVALALTFHGGAGEFGDRRDTGEITYGGIDF